MKYMTMEAVKNAYQPCKGRHWFDKDTMRFFKCRLPRTAYVGPCGVFFVSSEKGPSEVRRYTVRQFSGPGEVKTVGPFNEYTRSTANLLAAKYATEGVGASEVSED